MNFLQLRVIFTPPNLLIWLIIYNLKLKKCHTANMVVLWWFSGGFWVFLAVFQWFFLVFNSYYNPNIFSVIFQLRNIFWVDTRPPLVHYLLFWVRFLKSLTPILMYFHVDFSFLKDKFCFLMGFQGHWAPNSAPNEGQLLNYTFLDMSCNRHYDNYIMSLINTS